MKKICKECGRKASIEIGNVCDKCLDNRFPPELDATYLNSGKSDGDADLLEEDLDPEFLVDPMDGHDNDG